MSRYSEIKKETAEMVGIRVVRKSNTAKAHAAVRDVIVANPVLSYQRIAYMLGYSRWLVYRVAGSLMSDDPEAREVPLGVNPGRTPLRTPQSPP